MEQTTSFLRVEGHRIAYGTVGQGPPLVLPAWWVSNVAEDWGGGRFRKFIESLATRRRVVRYDRPGTGLSDRERPPETLTLDFEVATLAGVIDALELERPALLGVSCGGCLAAQYAAEHPERVERVAFYGSYADGRRLGPEDGRKVLVDLVRTHWGLGSRLLADVFGPSWQSADRQAFASFQRYAADAPVAADLLELIYACDVRERLPEVVAPSLVVHRADDRAIPFRCGRDVAALLPGAPLEPLEGDAHLPWHGDPEPVLAAVAPFLGIDSPAPRAPRAAGLDELSPREREVLTLVARGFNDTEIAEQLVLSPHTVHWHVANIRTKLRLPSRSAAAAAAARAGLI